MTYIITDLTHVPHDWKTPVELLAQLKKIRSMGSVGRQFVHVVNRESEKTAVLVARIFLCRLSYYRSGT